MADEREGQSAASKPTADKDKAGGRKESDRGPERYPAVRQDDAVEPAARPEGAPGERRSFDPVHDAPTQPQQEDEGRLGPRGDPAEGKR
jgi:hypothetical protein